MVSFGGGRGGEEKFFPSSSGFELTSCTLGSKRLTTTHMGLMAHLHVHVIHTTTIFILLSYLGYILHFITSTIFGGKLLCLNAPPTPDENSEILHSTFPATTGDGWGFKPVAVRHCLDATNKDSAKCFLQKKSGRINEVIYGAQLGWNETYRVENHNKLCQHSRSSYEQGADLVHWLEFHA